jgi:hypothetical protein
MRRIAVLGMVLFMVAVSGRADAGGGFVADSDDANLVDIKQYAWGNDANTIVFNMFTYEPFSDSSLRQWTTSFDFNDDAFPDACLIVDNNAGTLSTRMYGAPACSQSNVLTGASYERRYDSHVALVVPLDLLHRAGLGKEKTSYEFQAQTVDTDRSADSVGSYYAWHSHDLAPDYVPPPPCGSLRPVADLVRPRAPAVADVLCGV